VYKGVSHTGNGGFLFSEGGGRLQPDRTNKPGGEWEPKEATAIKEKVKIYWVDEKIHEKTVF